MTEDEGRTKWCPMVRYASIRGRGINRWVAEDDKQLNPEPSRCIASDCMMWQWSVSPDDVRAQEIAHNKMAARQQMPTFRGKPHGQCGLIR